MTEAKDWLVLTLDSQHEPIRIQKTLFKLAREAGLPPGEQYQFRPYNWGPFSAAIYQDIDDLVEAGLVERVPKPGVSWANYRLTTEGEQEAMRLREEAERNSLENLQGISTWVRERPFGKLLQDLYSDYPDMAQNSLFQQYT